MSSHITINGRTFASVEEMPPEIRCQYESAVQLIARNSAASASTPDSDVNISTQDGDPAHRAFKTVAQMTTRRIIVNGREYHDMKDVPPEFRAVLQDAVHNAAAHDPIAQVSHQTNVPRTPAGRPPDVRTFEAATGLTVRLPALIFLLLLALVTGILLGKFVH
jgi:hypothetical protein